MSFKTIRVIFIFLAIMCLVLPYSAWDVIFPWFETYVVPVLGIYYCYRFVKWFFTDQK